MSLILSGTDGLSDIDGSAATPAIRGTDANTGIFFGTDIIGFSEGGAEVARFNADAQFVAAAGTASLPVITTTGDVNTGIFFPAADTIAFSEGGAEVARFDSSGNLGIGVTPSYRLEVKGPSATAGQLSIHDGTGDTTVSGNAAASLLFQARDTSVRTIAEIDAVNTTTNGTGGAMVFQTRISDTLAERMRIDGSGNLLLGTTTNPGGSARLGIKGSGTTISTVSLYIINSSSVGNFLVYDDGSINTGTTSAGSPYVNTTGTAANAVLSADGFLRRSTSSLKYKTDIQDATHGLADLLKLRSVTYKGKNDGNIIFGGLIAEEVDAAGLNEFVQYAADGSPDALAYGNMVSLCVKAIQEQQALITALTARIEALETQSADNPPQGETP
jgi:hypothetical protein